MRWIAAANFGADAPCGCQRVENGLGKQGSRGYFLLASDKIRGMTRNQKTIAAVIAAFTTLTSYAAESDLSAIRREVAKRHDQAVKRLQDWIALPSIAAEDRN